MIGSLITPAGDVALPLLHVLANEPSDQWTLLKALIRAIRVESLEKVSWQEYRDLPFSLHLLPREQNVAKVRTFYHICAILRAENLTTRYSLHESAAIA